MKRLIENLELVLTGVGLLVIFACAFFLGKGDPQNWSILTLVAVAIGILHGFIFWIVRRRQREVRRKALAEVQQMLKDVINNQLAVIQLTHETAHNNPTVMADATARITQSIDRIAASLHELSEESLSQWRSQYDSHTLGEP